MNGRMYKLWSSFLHLVHVTLFFELLAHALPQGMHWLVEILQYTLPMVEAHAALFSLALGIAVSFASEAFKAPEKQPAPAPARKKQRIPLRTKKNRNS